MALGVGEGEFGGVGVVGAGDVFVEGLVVGTAIKRIVLLEYEKQERAVKINKSIIQSVIYLP